MKALARAYHDRSAWRTYLLKHSQEYRQPFVVGVTISDLPAVCIRRSYMANVTQVGSTYIFEVVMDNEGSVPGVVRMSAVVFT